MSGLKEKLQARLPKKAETAKPEKAAKEKGRSLVSYFQSQKDRKYILRLTATLLVITVVASALLGIVYAQTKPTIDKRIREKTEAAMRSVLEADYYRSIADYAGENGVTSLNEAVVGGRVGGYVCEVDSNGFGGAMSLVVGVDLEGFVTGVAVIKHSETQNIGTKVVESEAVLADFEGLSGPIAMGGGEEGFDAVSGATYSSNGVLAAVNAALDAVAAIQ